MLEVGQVLSLKLRFNNMGDVSKVKHPYLVLSINQTDINVVEVGQLDSCKGKEYKLAFKSNKLIEKNNETVIDCDSYIQMDNKIQIENFPELENYRRQINKLSDLVLREVLEDYFRFQQENLIDENKCVYISKEELISLN